MSGIHVDLSDEPCRSGSDPVAIGIDLGGTKVLAGAASSTGDILATREVPTTPEGANALLIQLVELARDVAGEAKVESVVIGVPASVDPQTYETSLSPNLDLGSGKTLVEGLSAKLDGCSVLLENDVNLAALGEAHVDLDQPFSSLAFLSFGTGVGMGLIVDGKIWRGHSGRAGEIGYLPVGLNPHQEARKSIAGLFEDQVGSVGFRNRYGSSAETVRMIFERARAGEKQAMQVIDAVARDAAVGLVAIQALFDPVVIFLGGGIGVQTLFAEAVQRHAADLIADPVRIEIARLGSQAGMLGAIHLAVANGFGTDIQGVRVESDSIPA